MQAPGAICVNLGSGVEGRVSSVLSAGFTPRLHRTGFSSPSAPTCRRLSVEMLIWFALCVDQPSEPVRGWCAAMWGMDIRAEGEGHQKWQRFFSVFVNNSCLHLCTEQPLLAPECLWGEQGSPCCVPDSPGTDVLRVPNFSSHSEILNRMISSSLGSP